MRYPYLAVAIMFSALPAAAQDWALLNPDYTYNYSLGGTDTITNQVFATSVETLGPDHFNFVTNRIGVQCDTCPGTLGGGVELDGAYAWLDQEQFLGGALEQNGSEWTLHTSDGDRLLLPQASIGASWTFASGITASVTASVEGTSFGIIDSIKTIALSNGREIVVSKAFGLLSYPSETSSLDHVLVGVAGPDVGHLLPGIREYFDFQPGDELFYRVMETIWVDEEELADHPFVHSDLIRILIADREDLPSGVSYTTQRWHKYQPSSFPTIYSAQWPVPGDPWVFDDDESRMIHPLIAAYPGQLMDSLLYATGTSGRPLAYLAQHAFSSDGHDKMISRTLSYPSGPGTDPNSDIDLEDPIAPGLYGQNGNYLWAEYEEGLGLLIAQTMRSMMQWAEVELIGAIKDGDTLIAPPEVDWIPLSIEEAADPGFHLYPDPASNELFLRTDGAITSEYRIINVAGQLFSAGPLLTDRHHRLDVSALPNGMYLLQIITAQGSRTQHFIISR